MTDPPAIPPLQRYQTAIAHLQTAIADTKPTEVLLPVILEVLAARDELARCLQETKPMSGQDLAALAQLDQDLKAQAAIVEQCLQQVDWQQSFHPPEPAWWWFLKPEQPNPWWNQDWLWQAVSVTCITISLGLAGDISTRFLKDGPDALGAITISTQTVLTLLTAGGALTTAGQEANKRLLKRCHVPEQYWHELGAGFSVLLLVGAVGLRQSLPQMATWYAGWGGNHYKQGDWGAAEADYKRALQLNPDADQTHFRLGLLYEELQDTAQARNHYQLAAQAGIPEAINNLSRLNLLDKKPAQATPLLLKALEQADQLPTPTQYALLKNLGWARFQQGDYSEAESYFQDAIALQATAKSAETAANPAGDTTLAIASPYCLLAQVQEAQKQAALSAWEDCNRYANPFIPEENAWAITARKKLKAQEREK